jgi:pimeloyl-ACP methyl ester carboxylesterase
MLIIHGGNEAPSKTVAPSIRMTPEILKDGYYPIFIHWNSWILGAYIEQLFCIRSGWYRRYAHVTGPFCLVGDIVTSLASIVPSTVAQLSLAVKRRRSYVYPTTVDLERFGKKRPNIEVNLGAYQGKQPMIRRMIMIGKLPMQVLLSSPLVNVVVPRAWQNLLRRTKAMFRTPREFDPKMVTDGYRMPDGSAYSPREGAMALFLSELEKTIDGHPELDIKVNIVAHSMGAMIANETIATAPNLPYQTLVYMAPACSVREFADTVSPMILRRAPNVQAHVLTLHPQVEAIQTDFKGLAPVGSVLEWLEGFLTPPNSYLDRFLGKWDNLLRSLHIFDDGVRPYIHIKGFPYDAKNRRKPYRHVHFNDEDVCFWKESFWT